ncbi:MAG: hypothetical protein ACYC9M_08680, partial [Desulfobulbaceae bacterium]
YSARWRSIKGYFSHEIAKLFENPRKNAKGEYQFWQRRFGNTQYEMRRIFHGMPITSITIRSNTVLSRW